MPSSTARACSCGRLGREQRACEVDILRPTGARYRNWRVATAMRRAGAPAYGFGTYRAADYDELIDHPVEMGEFTLATFRACGVPHDIAITGRHNADIERLCRDLKTLCEWHIRLFGEPAPMDRYVFLVTALGEGYGGLEHRASTALLCSRDDLPAPGSKRGHRELPHLPGPVQPRVLPHLERQAHQAGRLRALRPRRGRTTPRCCGRSRASPATTTTSRWCARGLISQQDYLETLGRSITNLLRSLGRMKQTVAEASWDAWIKYYRQDENSPNALVSYYLKGSLIALCLDLLIRSRTRGRKSLDDVMLALWQRHGQTGVGVPEDGIEKLAEEIAGARLRSFFDKALRSTDELPLKQWLASVGLDMQLRPAEVARRQGRQAGAAAGARAGGARRPGRAHRRGSCRRAADPCAGRRRGAGRRPVRRRRAGRGRRVCAPAPAIWTSASPSTGPGTRTTVHAFRRDELFERTLVLQGAPVDTCSLAVDGTDAAARRRRERWLAGE